MELGRDRAAGVDGADREVHVSDLALMPSVDCDGPATDCSAALLIDGC